MRISLETLNRFFNHPVTALAVYGYLLSETAFANPLGAVKMTADLASDPRVQRALAGGLLVVKDGFYTLSTLLTSFTNTSCQVPVVASIDSLASMGDRSTFIEGVERVSSNCGANPTPLTGQSPSLFSAIASYPTGEANPPTVNPQGFAFGTPVGTVPCDAAVTACVESSLVSPTLASTSNGLAAAAAQAASTLNATQATLSATQATLVTTENTLAATQSVLANTQAVLNSTQSNLTQAEGTISAMGTQLQEIAGALNVAQEQSASYLGWASSTTITTGLLAAGVTAGGIWLWQKQKQANNSETLPLVAANSSNAPASAPPASVRYTTTQPIYPTFP